MMASSTSGVNEGLSLLSRIEAGTATVNSVSTIKGEDSVISAGDDKTVRVWVRRENNQYWPSVIQTFAASCSAMVYEKEVNSDGHVVYVGLGNGELHEFRLSSDLNRFEKRRTFQSHSSRVTCIKYVSSCKWILSTGRDKRMQWSCTETGRSLGTYESSAWCLAVEHDKRSNYAFVAEFNGDITVLKLEERSLTKVTILKGHSGSVWSLAFDSERRILFSGGFDSTIVVWDIGSQKGTSYELNGHSGKIKYLYYSPHMNKLLSFADDGFLWLWDLDKSREENPLWEQSDRCEICNAPFFWNFRGMWTDKSVPRQMVVRQHHCRRCGRAVCASCSNNSTKYPKQGFETPVRVCSDCYSSITQLDLEPGAFSINVKMMVTSMSMLHEQNLMVTASEDQVIKVWDISELGQARQ